MHDGGGQREGLFRTATPRFNSPRRPTLPARATRRSDQVSLPCFLGGCFFFSRGAATCPPPTWPTVAYWLPSRGERICTSVLSEIETLLFPSSGGVALSVAALGSERIWG